MPRLRDITPHVGAHADAPLHHDPQGAAVGALDLEPCLLLDEVPEGDDGLIALPLKLMTADTSPVRARGAAFPVTTR